MTDVINRALKGDPDAAAACTAAGVAIPCGHCGGKAELVKSFGHKLDTSVMPYRVPWAIICTNVDCGSNMGVWYEKQDALAAWNRRVRLEEDENER